MWFFITLSKYGCFEAGDKTIPYENPKAGPDIRVPEVEKVHYIYGEALDKERMECILSHTAEDFVT